MLIGFFLPGDSLLFVTGLFIAASPPSFHIGINIGLACVILAIAALVGNVTGYWIGHKAGPALFRRPDSKVFKQEYVDQTHHFFERYGPRAIVMARFVPIVRTFITAVAGIGRSGTVGSRRHAGRLLPGQRPIHRKPRGTDLDSRRSHQRHPDDRGIPAAQGRSVLAGRYRPRSAREYAAR